MHDSLINAIGPVIVKNFDIICLKLGQHEDLKSTQSLEFKIHKAPHTWILKRCSFRGLDIIPLKPFLPYKIRNRSILLIKAVDKLFISALIQGTASEFIDFVGLLESLATVKVPLILAQERYILTSSCTSGHVRRWNSLSGTLIMALFLSEMSRRKSGHSAGHWGLGTLTSQ